MSIQERNSGIRKHRGARSPYHSVQGQGAGGRGQWAGDRGQRAVGREPWAVGRGQGAESREQRADLEVEIIVWEFPGRPADFFGVGCAESNGLSFGVSCGWRRSSRCWA
jgi:hypothetical protein